MSEKIYTKEVLEVVVKTSTAFIEREISQLKKEIRLLGSMAGNPDAVKGCQLIVKKVREVLDE